MKISIILILLFTAKIFTAPDHKPVVALSVSINPLEAVKSVVDDHDKQHDANVLLEQEGNNQNVSLNVDAKDLSNQNRIDENQKNFRPIVHDTWK